MRSIIFFIFICTILLACSDSNQRKLAPKSLTRDNCPNCFDYTDLELPKSLTSPAGEPNPWTERVDTNEFGRPISPDPNSYEIIQNHINDVPSKNYILVE